jgi:flagellar motility protein MotE (MotC chaperone)
MLKSPWFLALLAIVLGIGTTAGVIISKKDELIAAPAKSEPKSPMPANAPRDWIFWTDEINKLAANLKDEREALDERTKELEQFEKRLAGERDELRKVRVELEGMRREVTDNIPKIEASEKANVKSLAKTYSSMKPQDAVAVMRELDDSSIFQEMAKAKDVDGTLAVRAARISEQLRLVQSQPKTASQP